MSDVVIVGAGPAGTSIALQLARAGVDVAILERLLFPRNKVCGEYLSSAAIQALHDLKVEDCLSGAYPIRGIALAAYGSQQLRLALPGGGAFALARATLDDRLLHAALAAGARLWRGGYMYNEPDAAGQRVVFRDDHGALQSLRTRMLVGADGAWSSVAVRNGMAAQRRRGGRWAVGGHLTHQAPSDELEMNVGPGGYFARNPLSRDSVNAMLVLPQPARAEETDGIVKQITSGRRDFDESALVRRVAVGPLRYAPQRLMRERVILSGDAAGLLDPFIGQGVACALRLSFGAAQAVLARLAGVPQERVARGYIREWRSIIAPRKALSFLIDAMIRTPFLRVRAERAAYHDAGFAEKMLAAVSGAAPAASAFSPQLLMRLLAS